MSSIGRFASAGKGGRRRRTPWVRIMVSGSLVRPVLCVMTGEVFSALLVTNRMSCAQSRRACRVQQRQLNP